MINGCNNRPRPVANKPLLVQDGYVPGMFTYEAGHTDRIDRIVTVPYVMSTDCQYGASATDPGCAGCAHAPHLRHLAAPEAPAAATDQPSAGQVDERASINDDPEFGRLTLTWADAVIAANAGGSKVSLMNAFDALVAFIDRRASLTPTAPQAASQQAGAPVAWIATDLDGRAGVGFTKEAAMREAGEGCTEFIPLFDLGAAPQAATTASAACTHEFYYFGDQVSVRRCLHCNKLEDAATTASASGILKPEKWSARTQFTWDEVQDVVREAIAQQASNLPIKGFELVDCGTCGCQVSLPVEYDTRRAQAPSQSAPLDIIERVYKEADAHSTDRIKRAAYFSRAIRAALARAPLPAQETGQ